MQHWLNNLQCSSAVVEFTSSTPSAVGIRSTILTTIGDKMTQAEVDDLIRMADRDGKYNLMAGDGQLDYEEFARFLTSK
jgi:hypothetical protein